MNENELLLIKIYTYLLEKYHKINSSCHGTDKDNSGSSNRIISSFSSSKNILEKVEINCFSPDERLLKLIISSTISPLVSVLFISTLIIVGYN